MESKEEPVGYRPLYRRGCAPNGTSTDLRAFLRSVSVCDESVPSVIRHIYASRVARRWAGTTLLVSILLVVSGILPEIYLELFGTGRTWWGCGLRSCGSYSGDYVTYAFLHTWIFAAVAYAAGYGIAQRRLVARVIASKTAEPRPRERIPSIALPRLSARIFTESEEALGMAQLLAGLTLLLPLTVAYLLYASAEVLRIAPTSSAEFGRWLKDAGILTWHIHAIAAVGAWRYGRKIETVTEGGAMHPSFDHAALRLWVICTVASVLSFARDPLAVFPATLLAGGALFFPLFAWARNKTAREREGLEAASLPPAQDTSEATLDWLTEIARARGVVDDRGRVVALRALADRFRFSRVAAVIDALLDPAHPAVAAAVLRIGIENYHRLPIDRVLECVRTADPDLQIACARILKRYRDPRVEPALTSLLLGGDRMVAVEVSEALGYTGSPASVKPMRDALHRLGGKDLRSAVRTAIERIHDRQGPVEKGRLSIVSLSGAEGALSVPAVESGRISLPIL